MKKNRAIIKLPTQDEKRLLQASESLSGTQKSLLMWKFGLSGCEKLTMPQICQKLNLTRDQYRLLYMTALITLDYYLTPPVYRSKVRHVQNDSKAFHLLKSLGG